jgi:hypothetical protein
MGTDYRKRARYFQRSHHDARSAYAAFAYVVADKFANLIRLANPRCEQSITSAERTDGRLVCLLLGGSRKLWAVWQNDAIWTHLGHTRSRAGGRNMID